MSSDCWSVLYFISMLVKIAQMDDEWAGTQLQCCWYGVIRSSIEVLGRYFKPVNVKSND